MSYHITNRLLTLVGDKDEETKGKKKRGRKPTASLKHTCDTSVEPEIGPQRKKKKQAIQPNQKIECSAGDNAFKNDFFVHFINMF